MLVRPTGVLLNGDLGGETKLALLNFDTFLLAFGILAPGAGILGLLCSQSVVQRFERQESREARAATYQHDTA